ncbi:hypothetical protein A4A49_59626 [Nicotiana attenuata]|uniref:Uncharacterized protein n=1 Tax=Nicotiana attenuata TaxID=49451 RepID=A0A314LEY5_NICAT|nr:hypothetical protein A4A49_59626 [Nicotiana attenuata]
MSSNHFVQGRYHAKLLSSSDGMICRSSKGPTNIHDSTHRMFRDMGLTWIFLQNAPNLDLRSSPIILMLPNTKFAQKNIEPVDQFFMLESRVHPRYSS